MAMARRNNMCLVPPAPTFVWRSADVVESTLEFDARRTRKVYSRIVGDCVSSIRFCEIAVHPKHFHEIWSDPIMKVYRPWKRFHRNSRSAEAHPRAAGPPKCSRWAN
ncbi:hypothetical protein BDM02DRAFT_3109882 [Thelephora ganbajun]|uniref:Uncharacterized protein n=1 Tax=Thelephora ganbajun TaxID=370292 RepID=A0ACB6ZQA9_THEGA|nr:hypothetical protein BDM02DRAFT_3109882 [Thelephora ganbajun]